MRFSVLGSGSRGNATLVSADSTHILVDAGFSGRELARRLGTTGIDPGEIAAIVLTHEHGDHARGAGIFARLHGTPLHMTAGTLRACRRLLRGKETVHTLRPGYPVALGALRIEPFATLHDAADPIAVAVVDARRNLRLGIATDLGRPTLQLRHALGDCNGLVLESNHDEVLLWSSDYPASVKARIASSHGHLSNQSASRFARELLHPELAVVVLAHLSEESNTPADARSVMTRTLRRAGFEGGILVAEPDAPTPLVDLRKAVATSAGPQLSLFRESSGSS